MSQSHNEEFTLRDIFLMLGGYVAEVRSRWKIALIVGGIIGVIMAVNAYRQPALYKEKLTFMMDETQGEGMQGFDLLGGLFGGKKQDNLGKILQLFESKKIVHNTLFDSITIDGKADVLANHFLDLYTIPYLAKDYKYFNLIGWKVRFPSNLKADFRFTKVDPDEFSPKENLYLQLIYEKIAGNPYVGVEPLLGSILDEETGIMTLTMQSEYEELTLGVLNNIYKQLSAFFIEKSIEKQLKTYKIMTAKKDSIIGELKGKEFALANFKDRNRKLVTVKGYLEQLRLERDVAVLNVMYAEVIKQQETTDFALRNKTPVVQVIDLPRRPIGPIVESWKRGLLSGGMLGLAMVLFFFVGRRFFLTIMEE